MTHTRKVIQDAIEGGRKVENLLLNGEIINPTPYSSKGGDSIPALFLDPLFWQAVGKTREWNTTKSDMTWRARQMEFVNWLQEGDNYEIALSKLV